MTETLMTGASAPISSVRSAQRFTLIQSLFKRLDTELAQVVVEALEEAARAVNADVAAIFEQDNDTLHCTNATDPSLLEKRVPLNGNRAVGERGSSRLRSAAAVAEALVLPLHAADREWLLMFGERTSQIDHAVFEQEAQAFVEVFEHLLRREYGAADRSSQLDHVTALPDRRATMNQLNDTMAAAKRSNSHAALLFIDLNGFKGVNDSYGHAHGDAVLKLIAMTMRDALRKNEFVGRIGGDEFAVILPVVRNEEEAIAAARRLSEGVKALEIEHDSGRVSLSVGIAYYPEHAASSDDWLHHADLAMYQAKRQYETCCVYSPNEGSLEFSGPAIAVEEAYARKFLLCFQPIFDVETGSVVAAEALLRSLHPAEGVQSASTTMEIARSQRESMEHLDAWVARRALAYADAWRAQGVARIHVNIGEASEDALTGVLRAIDSSGRDTSMLALELEWQRFIEDPVTYATFADSAERCGVFVGLDAFAQNAVELAKLERMAVRFVKPSKQFLPSGGATEKSMEAIVALSHVYGWDVIATRVATSDDRASIRRAGVRYMQGFAVAQPMTAIDFSQWIESSPRIALVS